MTTSGRSADLQGAEFVEADLRGARFVGSDLSDAVMRGVNVDGADVSAPWLLDGTSVLIVNGVDAMPPGTVDICVGGEWSFAQTLRHLGLATDAWLGRAVLGIDEPFSPIGQPSGGEDGLDTSISTPGTPSYEEVVAVRSGRVAMVRDFLALVTPGEPAAERPHPWSPEYPETAPSCVHVVLEEEWERLRYAVRDLDLIEATAARGSGAL